MSKAAAAFEKLAESFSDTDGITKGQMFGKACLKLNGKAFLAQHNDRLVFKLTGPDHKKAMAVTDAKLWDPSGKKRPMKEWVSLPETETRKFSGFAQAALAYAESLAA